MLGPGREMTVLFGGQVLSMIVYIDLSVVLRCFRRVHTKVDIVLCLESKEGKVFPNLVHIMKVVV